MTLGSGEVHSTFRDPAGRVFRCGERIIRVVDQPGRESVGFTTTSPTLRTFIASGKFIGSRELDSRELHDLIQYPSIGAFLQSTREPVVVEHDAVDFPSYPYEWPPEMLHAAAILTLDLCQALLDEGLGLKDASPYNVLFRGACPVFVDVLSVEKRRDEDPVWLAYAQFVRTFLLPLLASRRWRIPLVETLLVHRDGLEPADVYKRCGVLERYTPGVLGLVSLPTWLDSRKASKSVYKPRSASSAEQSRFILRSTFRSLHRQLARLKPQQVRSQWSEYAAQNSYSDAEANLKQQFVTSMMERYRPKRVLDIGCNTGVFSVIAAKQGATVVAVDIDEASVGGTYRTASQLGLSVLPLVVDIARPTPAIGWINAEHASFLSRATGHFDAVFMLALLHHLLVTERVPLPEILDLSASLTSGLLLIEYVGRTDPMFQRIVRGREALHENVTRDLFELECKRRFVILESQQVQADRWLYLLKRQT